MSTRAFGQLAGRLRQAHGHVVVRFRRGTASRDAAWLFGGQVVALTATFVATPLELHGMGSERYGVVVVVTASVGYLGVLDLGVGYALMRYVPWYRAHGREAHVHRLVSSALVLAAALGVVAGLAFWLLSPTIADVFRLSESTRAPATTALRLMAFFLPTMLLISALTGLGRAVGLFWFSAVAGAVNVVVLNLVWVLVAGTHDDIVIVAFTQLVLGLVVVIAWLVAVSRAEPGLLLPLQPARRSVRELVSFGGRAALGQGSFGLLTQADKVVFASVLAVGLLPLYSIPFNLALRITLISSSAASAVFPRVAAAVSASDTAEVRRLSIPTLRVVALASGAIATWCLLAGRPFLELWIGSDFAADGWKPLAVLAFGFAVQSSGSIAGILLDATGRIGLHVLLIAVGGFAGLSLGAGLAVAWNSPLGAAVGVAAGLGATGLAALELSRRLVLKLRLTQLAALIFGPWLALLASGGVVWVLIEIASPPALVRVAAITLALGAAVGLVYAAQERGRARRANSALA